MVEEERSCKNCIHAFTNMKKRNEETSELEREILCSPFKAMVILKREFENEYQFIKFPAKPEELAKSCPLYHTYQKTFLEKKDNNE